VIFVRIDAKTALDQYVSHISAIDGVSQVYLFGSHANGVPNEGSDIDLLVVIDDCLDVIKTAFMIQKSLANRVVPLDLLVNRESDFSNASEGITLQSHIQKEGVLLYERQ
jgi:predicted nucleotidyltransferase